MSEQTESVAVSNFLLLILALLLFVGGDFVYRLTRPIPPPEAMHLKPPSVQRSYANYGTCTIAGTAATATTALTYQVCTIQIGGIQ